MAIKTSQSDRLKSCRAEIIFAAGGIYLDTVPEVINRFGDHFKNGN